MYNNLLEQTIQDKPTKDKPDLAMMKKAYELFFCGFRDQEIVGFGQHYEGPNFKYLNYDDFRENLDELVEWQANSGFPNACFLPNPIRDDYQQTTGEITTSSKSKNPDFVRVCWYLLDLDRVKALRYPAGPKDYSPATPEELKMLSHANNSLMEFLDSIGFACLLNHHSGNGYGIAVPVHFANTKEVSKKFLAMNKIIQECLADFPEVEIDNGFASPRQPWSIPGSLNKKAGRATLRKALNYNKFTPDDILNSRQSNSLCLEGHLAEAQILVANDYQPKGKLVFNEQTSGSQSEMAGYLDSWESDNPLLEQLTAHGYKVIKQFDSKAYLQRPDKDGFGHGLVIGGEKNRLWNWSSSDDNFPVGVSFRPYWVHLILKGIVKDGKPVDYTAFKAFFKETANRYGRPFSLENQVNLKAKPATLEPVEVKAKPATLEPVEVKQEPRQATGTLAEIVLPGIVEDIAQAIMATNSKHSPSTDRVFALALFQLMIGKSRIYKTGLSCNSYFVNLAPSSAGKEAGKTFITRFMEYIGQENEKTNKPSGIEKGTSCYGYLISDPSASAQGLSDEALAHGRILIIGDESERFLHPEESNRESIQVRNLLLSVSTSGLIPGRALASGATRKTAGNCFVSQIHTIQPKAYFGSFKSDQDTKGFIGRLIHFEANKGITKDHRNINPSGYSKELIKAGIYWQSENLKGIERQSESILEKGQTAPSLGRFQPERLTVLASDQLYDKMFEYAKYCDDMATKELLTNNGLLEKFWDKNSEHCIRLALTFTLAVDQEAKHLSLEAWDLATKIMGLSKLVLLKNQSGILKTKAEQLEDDIVNHLQQIWARGENLPSTEIWRKFRSRFNLNHRLWEEMQISLQSLGLIRIERAAGAGKPSFIICKPVE